MTRSGSPLASLLARLGYGPPPLPVAAGRRRCRVPSPIAETGARLVASALPADNLWWCAVSGRHGDMVEWAVAAHNVPVHTREEASAAFSARSPHPYAELLGFLAAWLDAQHDPDAALDVVGRVLCDRGAASYLAPDRPVPPVSLAACLAAWRATDDEWAMLVAWGWLDREGPTATTTVTPGIWCPITAAGQLVGFARWDDSAPSVHLAPMSEPGVIEIAAPEGGPAARRPLLLLGAEALATAVETGRDARPLRLVVTTLATANPLTSWRAAFHAPTPHGMLLSPNFAPMVDGSLLARAVGRPASDHASLLASLCAAIPAVSPERVLDAVPDAVGRAWFAGSLASGGGRS